VDPEAAVESVDGAAVVVVVLEPQAASDTAARARTTSAAPIRRSLLCFTKPPWIM